MKKNNNVATQSLAQLQDVRTLTVVGILIAMKIALDFMTLQITPSIHLSFEFVVGGIVGMMYGPVVGMLYGMAGDLICCFVNPKGAFFIGFTLVAMVSGVINGCILYKKKPTLKRVIAVRVLNVFICNIILNTLCLICLYSSSTIAMIPSRIIKNFMMLPIEVVVMYFVLNKVSVIEKISINNK